MSTKPGALHSCRAGSGSPTGIRVGASPAAAYALNRAWFETDLREVLPAVRVPALVMYRTVSEVSDCQETRNGTPAK